MARGGFRSTPTKRRGRTVVHKNMAEYFSAKEIVAHKSELAPAISKPSYFDRSGRIKVHITKSFPFEVKILDIGSGAAHLPHSLKDAGFNDVQLVDIDDYANGDFFVHKADVSVDKLPLADESVDVVTAVTIFEHLENPLHCLREIHRVLKSGGYLYVALPSIHSLRSRFRFLFKGELQSYYPTNNHIFIFTDALIQKFFRDFDLLTTYYGDPYVKVFNIRVPVPEIRPLDKLFSNNVLYIFRKK